MSASSVAILISAYQAEEHIRASVESALEQTHPDTSVWVMDDGSTDRTWEILERIDDPRLTTFRSENRGKSVAMNELLDACDASYFVMQDADDFSHPERAAVVAAHLDDDTELALVMSGYEAFVEGGSSYRVSRTMSVAQAARAIDRYEMPSLDPTMAGRVEIGRAIRFDPDFRLGQGVDFVWRVGEQYAVRVIPDVLYRYRVHPASITHRDPKSLTRRIAAVSAAAMTRRTGREVSVEDAIGALDIRHDRTNNMLGIYMMAVNSALDAGDRREALRIGRDSARDVRLGVRYLKPLLAAIGVRRISWRPTGGGT